MLVGVLFSTLLSCSKEQEAVTPAVDNPQGAAIDEETVKARITEISVILRKIYQDPAVRAEVNAAIATGYYEDERVLLSDLLHPESSPVYQTAKFRELRKKAGANFEDNLFARRFREAADRSNPRARTTDEDDAYWTTPSGYIIYFPYSELHQGSNAYNITVV
ncbi:MAG: hypothetical protein H7Z75_14395, partial [Ferruginibacter sp.]|nr:hypothetical protein [Cytophagales bacterium]